MNALFARPADAFPRRIAQLLGTVLTAFVQVGVKRWLVANVRDLCERGQAAQLTCPNVQVFSMASTIW